MDYSRNSSFHFGPVLLSTFGSLAVSLLMIPGAYAACQDVCHFTYFGLPVNCTVDAQCTGVGDYCDHSAGCCDQAEENGSTATPTPTGACVCGDTLSGDVTLKHDILCTSGDGLIVDTAGEDLHLDGHVIACDGTGGACGTGVQLTGGGTTVKGGATGNKGGRIEGFSIGVSNYNDDGEASQLTISDAGLSMEYGIYGVKTVKKNVITGAAGGYFGGHGIYVSASNCLVEDNLVTDSTRGIDLGVGDGGSNCRLIHNRAVGNDYGLIVYFGNFDATNSVDNIFLNNSMADYADTNTSNRLATASNVCRLSGAGNACTLSGMDFTP